MSSCHRAVNFVAAVLTAVVAGAVGIATAQVTTLPQFPLGGPPGQGKASQQPAAPVVVDSKGKFVGYITGLVFQAPNLLLVTPVQIPIKGKWALAGIDSSGQNLVGLSHLVLWSGPDCTGTPYLDGRGLIPYAVFGIPPGAMDVSVYYPSGAVKLNLSFASMYDLPGPPFSPGTCSAVTDSSAWPAVYLAQSMPASSLGFAPLFSVKPPQ